jgi:hypothetical protein
VGLTLTLSVTGGAGADQQDVDQGDGATGAVQNGSNTALAGNGGGSTLDSEAAEITVGDIETGDGSTNEIRLTSTIETQISSADGGDLNNATVNDNDPVTDDRDVDIDDRDSSVEKRETTTTSIDNGETTTTSVDNRGALCAITIGNGGGDNDGNAATNACDNTGLPFP